MSDTTIIIATRDRERWLREAIRSAVAQDARVIVVDDCSEGPGAYVAAKLEHVEYLALEKPSGYIRARMAGLSVTTSEFVAFLDDDDVLDPGWLTASKAIMALGNDVVAGSYFESDEDGSVLSPVVLVQASLERLLDGHCPVNDGALIRRSILDRVRLDPKLDTVAIYGLWLALAKKGARFGVVERPIWRHRKHPTQMSAHLGPNDEKSRARLLLRYRHA